MKHDKVLLSWKLTKRGKLGCNCILEKNTFKMNVIPLRSFKLPLSSPYNKDTSLRVENGLKFKTLSLTLV